MIELRLSARPPAERADAARNRRRLLEAAARLFAQRGVEAVRMDDIAAAARVGKGTLYRRFGDKAGLGVAVLDARERDLQAAVLRGPQPLGPGARPGERLHAFVDAYLDYLERHLDLVVMCETASPGARFRSGVYGGWHRHVAALLDQAGVPRAETAAHLLLAMLDADLYRALTRTSPGRRAEVAASAHAVIDGMLRPPPRGPTRRPARPAARPLPRIGEDDLGVAHREDLVDQPDERGGLGSPAAPGS